VAYAYLDVDVGFQYPYYTCLSEFDFQGSTGARTAVTAFSAQTSEHGKDHEHVRDQVEVLYYNEGQVSDPVQFAVDLSKQTEPYQVIVARIPRGNTLGEASEVLQRKIAEFKNDPDYEVLRKLRPIDTLIAPDVAYRLTHHFSDLVDKDLGNEKWRGNYIFEAIQKIDFTLSRTGVVLKSRARMATTASKRPPDKLAKPRNLHFDRPFLICVQKREPNATPFFLMWVDNAELMKPYTGGDKGS
jgi:hypothetical protein